MTRRTTPVLLAVALVAVLTAGLVTAARGPRHDGPTPRATQSTDRYAALDVAVAHLNRARAAVLTDVTEVTNGATAVDSADLVAAQGDPAPLTSRWVAVDRAVATAGTAVGRLARDARDYAHALDALAVGARTLSGRTRSAVDAVVAAGRAERDALTEYAATAGQVWPRYVDLAAREHRWYDRASGGWYRSRQEAADAYAVFLVEVRDRIDAGRSRLMAVSERTRTAAATMERALAATRAP